MIWAASLVGITLLAAIVLKLMRPYRIRLVQSTGISAPHSVVFDLVSDADRVPGWYGEPLWLPSFLRVSTLSRWSEQIPRSSRIDIAAPDGGGDLQTREVRGREFGYCFSWPGVMTYETIFRLFPRQDGCQLTWELRFQLHRSVDKLAYRIRADREVWYTMNDSLQSIRCLCESIAVRPAWEKTRLAGISEHAPARESTQAAAVLE